LILRLSEAKAKILGPSDIYVKAGSAVTLTCMISQGPHDLGTIDWFKGEIVIIWYEYGYFNYETYWEDISIFQASKSSRVHRNIPTTILKLIDCESRRNGPMLSRREYASAEPNCPILAIIAVCRLQRPRVPASMFTSLTVSESFLCHPHCRLSS
jgi:hypothetical protein